MSNKPISLNNGRFETATDGASITNIQAASVSSGTLATAQLPIVPTNKGGFGIDVSTGLTNGYVAVVSGGAITIGPPPSVSPSGSAGGDLSGTYPNPTVAKIQNVSVDATAPTLNQALIFDGTKWAPANVSTSPTGSAGGDLANTYPNPSVVKIQGVAVDTTAPTSGQVMEYDGTKWAPANLPTSLPPSGPAGGDLLNNYPNPSVVKIQGTSVSNIAPTADQFLRYNFVNARWEPTTVSSLPPSGSASGDLSGTYPSPSVVKLQGQTVSNTTPTINQFLRFDGSQWKPDTTAGIIPALTRILYVDLNSASLSPTGSIAEPYTTISAAISAARTATPLTTTGVRYEWVILVSPGSYDEDISFDGTSMHISIMGNGGPFNLGAYAAGTANYAPTNARNITWTITAGNLDSIRHSLRIGTLGIPAEGTTTHIGYNTVPRISGVVNVVDNMLGGTTKEVYLSCVIEDFSATGTCFGVSGTGAPTGVTMLYAHRARFKSAVTGTQLRLQQSFNTQFDGLVTIDRHSGSNTSTFAAGLTLTSASTDIKPAGFVNCDISGTFTGPVNSLQCDGTTYKRFTNNGATLAGGATVNLLEPASTLTPKGIYVNGSVSVTGNGSFTLPFKTITEALAIATTGDVINIASGTYTENLTLPNIDNLSLIGAGKNSTIIDAVAASSTPTLKWAPLTGSYTKLTLKGFTLRNTNNSQYCLQLDGDGTAISNIAQFLTTECLIQDVICDKVTSTGDGFYFRSVDKLHIYDGNGSTISGTAAGWNCSGQFLNIGYCLVSNTILGNGVTGFTYTYDDTAGVVKANGGRQGLTLANTSTVYGTLTLTKAPYFGMAPDTALFGDFVATSLAIFTSPAHAPYIRVAGTLGSPGFACAVSITSPAITAPMVAAGAIPYVDFSGCTIWSSATKKVTMAGTAGGALRFGPMAHGTFFENVPPLSAINIISGAETDFDIKDATFIQSLLSVTGNGTIDRHRHAVFTAVPGAITIVPPLPSSITSSGYIVNIQETSSGTSMFVSSKTSTGFTLGGTGTADLLIERTP